MITKEEADKIMEIKGETKGSEYKTLATYILQKYGKEKPLLLEKKLEELGYPLKFDEINPMEWYSESLNVLAVIVAKDLFGLDDLFEFGHDSPKFSIGVKLFMKFSSMKRVFKACSKTWARFIKVGALEPYEFNEKERYLILHLKDYKFHPDMCLYFAGFFLRIAQYTQKSPKITIVETKCMFKGDPYHEYLIKWQ